MVQVEVNVGLVSELKLEILEAAYSHATLNRPDAG